MALSCAARSRRAMHRGRDARPATPRYAASPARQPWPRCSCSIQFQGDDFMHRIRDCLGEAWPGRTCNRVRLHRHPGLHGTTPGDAQITRSPSDRRSSDHSSGVCRMFAREALKCGPPEVVYPPTCGNERAGEGNRTPDLLITSEPLYRLSYPGGCGQSNEVAVASPPRRVGARPSAYGDPAPNLTA
jgi:hypothetical protein